jgi:hypothetical protein
MKKRTIDRLFFVHCTYKVSIQSFGEIVKLIYKGWFFISKTSQV